MVDVDALAHFASTQNLWVVEDAAHAFPAAWRADPNSEWQRCGQATADVSCFSFYANKTVTTGEGGMAVTESAELADRMRLMSLHGLRNNPNAESWNYEIAAAGYKYNLTDVAAALGIGQLEQAEEMRRKREDIALRYIDGFSDQDVIELSRTDPNRIHSWHLFQISLRLERLNITRNQFIEELKKLGILCSVHWKPLHLHPFYQKTFGWTADQFPNATNLWERLVSLPLFPTMTDCQVEYVISNIRELCKRHAH
jgi:perosamine synthetase